MNRVQPIMAVIVFLLTGAAYAQQRPEPAPAPAPPAVAIRPPTPPPPPPAPSPQVPGQLVNIRIDVTIAEEGGTEPPFRKTVSLTLADRQSGSVRSLETQDKGRANLDVDAFPIVQRDGRVRTQITVNYATPGLVKIASVRVEPLLASGKPLMVSQSVSPTSDRRLTVEVLATVLK